MEQLTKKKAGRPNLAIEQREKAIWYRPYDEARKGRRVHWTPTKINFLADCMIQWYEDNETKVSLGSFCWANKIPPNYLSIFARKNKYFEYNLHVIKALLESRLLEMGCNGEIDRVMAIFSLKNIAGWTDKREVSSTLEVTSTIVELQLPKKNKVIEVKAEIIEDKKIGKPRNNNA